MSAERRRSVLCSSPAGLHRLSYLEWGDAASPRTLVCVHGLTRVGRDFARLAEALAPRWRVVAPDLPGRGESDRLRDPMLYAVPQYVADMVTLIARLDVEGVAWVGTSLGGLVGMALAAQPQSPIERLVLNDAGPVIAKSALERIDAYLGDAGEFADLDAAIAYIRKVAEPFGPHSEEDWRFLTENVVRRGADGRLRLHYDPAIAEPYRRALPEKDLELWPLYDAIRCPVLVLRGERSDLLARETCEAMRARGPRAEVVEIPGVGHAPTLLDHAQIAIVRAFLERA